MRFPEFSGNWEKTALKDCTILIKERVPASSLTVDSYVSTENMVANFGGLTQANSLPSDINVIKFQLGDILISNIRPYLKKIWYADKEGGCSSDILVLRTKEGDAAFINYILSNDKFISYTMSAAKGVKMPRGDKAQMLAYEFSIPGSKEQHKIRDLLSLIDERIATQNKIIEDYNALMNSIMINIFAQVNKYGWRAVKLGDICNRITRKNSNLETDLVLTIASQYGLVSQAEFFNKTIASADLSNYFLLEKGDFAYNKSYSGDYSWGAVKRLESYQLGVLSPLYICFRPITDYVDSDFLTFLFESKCWYKEVSEICVEGARNLGLLNVSVADFFNIRIFIPSLDEQKKISERLKIFQTKLRHSQKLLSLYISQKKYLLSRLFV